MRLRSSPPYPVPDAVFAQFRPVTFWERGLVWRHNRQVSYAAWSPFSGLRPVTGPKPDNMADPLARRAMVATPAIRDFMRWSVMPMATVERSRCHAHVGFTDARFANFSVPFFKAENPFWHETILPLSGPGCPVKG
jgi:inner membrane protein